jgi:hypothetical protein
MIILHDAFQEISKIQCFGYSPTSSSTKPAHIANGWFRRIIGRRYDPVLLNQTVVHWTKNGEINPSDILLSEHPQIFEPYQSQSKRRDFAEFRADLKWLVSPVGGAVNKGNRLSSYNITCEHHITEDYNDREMGSFLYHLAATDLGKGPSPALKLLKEILENPRDEVSTVSAPLTTAAAATEVVTGEYPAETVFKKRGRAFLSPTLMQLRTGFDNLANFEKTYGGGLDALRRFVAFGVFSVLLHMQNRRSEIVGTQPAELNPALLYFHERLRSTAYQASHATYNLNRRSIESLYTDQLKEWLEPRIGKQPSHKKCQDFVRELEFAKGDEKKNREYREKCLSGYRSFASQLGNLEAMAEALRETVFRQASATPPDSYRSLGVRVGFLKPAGNNALRKYYTLEGVLLEAVVASILPEGEITYPSFLGEMHKRYGLIIGGRPEDTDLLMEKGIGIATVQDLRANSQVFRQQLLSLGWARKYADGVLIVQVPEGLR